MRFLSGFMLGLLIGGAAAWYMAPGPFRYFYSTSQAIELVSNGERKGTMMPAGTPMVSDEELVNEADRGWWAYVPVQFDGMHVARDMGVRRRAKSPSVMEITLGAYPDYDKLYPGPVKMRIYEGKVLRPKGSQDHSRQPH